MYNIDLPLRRVVPPLLAALAAPIVFLFHLNKLRESLRETKNWKKRPQENDTDRVFESLFASDDAEWDG